MLLVMSYTGPKAMRIKIAYIQAFNAMEAELAGQTQPLPRKETLPPPLRALPEPPKIRRDSFALAPGQAERLEKELDELAVTAEGHILNITQRLYEIDTAYHRLAGPVRIGILEKIIAGTPIICADQGADVFGADWRNTMDTLRINLNKVAYGIHNTAWFDKVQRTDWSYGK
jgi:hypothetical protein